MAKALDPKAGTDYLSEIDSSGDEKTGVLNHLNQLGQKDTILEIGPGGGSALKIIMQRVAQLDEEARPLVSILDISAGVLSQIEDLLREAGIQSGFETRQGDISRELPYEDGSVQAVNLSSVLHECFSYGGGEEGMKTFIKELNRILSVSGVVAYRDLNGVDLEKPASFKLKTELSRKFLVIFFAKYFDEKHTKYKKPNYHYLDNLSIREEEDGDIINCDAGLAHEFKRHLVIFVKTLLPEAIYSVNPVGEGLSKISFSNTKGNKKFTAFLKEKEIQYSESPDGIEVTDQAISEFQSEIDKGIEVLFSDCELILEDESDTELLSKFLEDNDVNHSKEGTNLKVDIKDLVLVYSKFKQIVFDQNIKAKFGNKKHEKLLDWFEREGEESYFYGDQLSVITKFLEYSLTEDPNNSMLGHTCLVPMGMDEILITQRQNYTAYILGQIEDIEGSYEDGKNTVTFVKRPVEAVIPTLLAIYEKTGDMRIMKSLKLIIDMIGRTLKTAEKATDSEGAILNRHVVDKQEVGTTEEGESVYGLIGGIASGKSTAAETFQTEGFEIIELSNFIRAEIEAAGIKLPTRDDYFEFGNAKRKKEGNDAFSNLAISEIERRKLKKTVISGIRTPEDVQRLRQRFPSFKAVAVDTPLETRIKRITDRMRDIDPRDKNKIIADIMREWEDVVEEGCKLKNTIVEADIRIDGSQDVDTLRHQCLALIKKNS